MKRARPRPRDENERYETLRCVPLRDSSSIRDPELSLRVSILNDTVEQFSDDHWWGGRRHAYLECARANLQSWSQLPRESFSKSSVEIVVEQSDLLDAVAKYTKSKGKIFAALNMANETFPGGGYTNGRAAQEENMARRTDMHFTFNSHTIEHDWSMGRPVYTKAMQSLINGSTGYVHLSEQPLVCIKGSETWNEDPTWDNFGYAMLKPDEIFPFFELRSAALNISRLERSAAERQWVTVDAIAETRRRIEAQFRTLKARGIRNVVLSAFGCGAFGNNPEDVARQYKQAIADFSNDFDTVVFAIFFAGVGANNYEIFKKVLCV